MDPTSKPTLIGTYHGVWHYNENKQVGGRWSSDFRVGCELRLFQCDSTYTAHVLLEDDISSFAMTGEKQDNIIHLKTTQIFSESPLLSDWLSSLQCSIQISHSTLHLSWTSCISSETPAMKPPTQLVFHSSLHSPVLSSPTPTSVLNTAEVKQWGMGLLVLHPSDIQAAHPTGFVQGRWTWDVKVTRCTTQYMGIGVATLGSKFNSYLGRDFTGWSFQPTGEKWHSNIGYPYGPSRPSYGEGDIITVELDMDSGTIAFYKNSEYFGVAFDNIKSNPIVARYGVFPAVTSYRTGDRMEMLGLRQGVYTDFFSTVDSELIKWEQNWISGKRRGFGVKTMRNKEVIYGVCRKDDFDGIVVVECEGHFTIRFIDDHKTMSPATDDQIRNYFGTSVVYNDSLLKPLKNEKIDPISVIPKISHTFAIHGGADLDQRTQFTFSSVHCAAGIELAEDLQTATCSTNNRCMVLGSRSFSRGKYYWEVKINDCELGTLFIGVAAKLPGSSHQCWRDYGFVNNRSFQSHATESFYGMQYFKDDVIGVLLDLDVGQLSFFKQGKEFYYFQHNQVDLGVAARQVRTGGNALQGCLLYPSFGFKRAGDSVTVLTMLASEDPHTAEACLQKYRFLQFAMNGVFFGNPEILPNCVKRSILMRYLRVFEKDQISVTVKGKIKLVLDTSQKALDSIAPQKGLKIGEFVEIQNSKRRIVGTKFDQIWYCDENTGDFWYLSEKEFSMLPTKECRNDEKPVVKQESFDWSKIVNFGTLKKLSGKLAEDNEMNGTQLNCVSAKEQYRYCIPELNSTETGIAICLLQQINDWGLFGIPLIPMKQVIPENPLKFASDVDTSFPTASLLLSRLKCLFTWNTKETLWNATLTLTAFFDSLRNDEFDRIVQIPEIKVNRVQSQRARASGAQTNAVSPSTPNSVNSPKLDPIHSSILSQLIKGLEVIPLTHFRREYNHVEDAGQKRNFFVRLVGEGVYDSGGPYREILTQATATEPFNTLGLAKVTANCENGIHGDELYEIVSIEESKNPLDFGQFLFYWGVLLGVCVRSNVSVSLPLISMFFKLLAGDDITIDDVNECEKLVVSLSKNFDDSIGVFGSLADVVELLPISELQKEVLMDVNLSIDREKWCQTMLQLVVQKKVRNMERFISGLNCVIPLDLCTIFTADEVKLLISGKEEITVKDMQNIVEYADDVNPNSNFIKMFWRVVESMTSKERSKLLEFVCARTRIPVDSYTPITFKIVRMRGGDKALPQSQTCFSILKLPEYSSDALMKKQLLYSINNAPTMELDVQLHDAEGWEE